MTLTFTPATKTALRARVALDGPSGSGKTYTALITGRTLAGPGGRVAVIDTERRSASLYADRFQFDTLALDTFDPRVLIDALAVAGNAGYECVVIDSLSHFWEGTDGMLEQVDRIAKRNSGGNTFAAWKDARPIERRMVDAMLAYPGHLIATMRTKTEWVVEQVERGGRTFSAPRKIGTKPVQREGIEYEFTLVGDMDLEHNLVITKSRCPVLADSVINRPDETFGLTLLTWLNDGDKPSESAQAIRDEILADPAMSSEDVKARGRRARAGGLLATALLDETGDTTTLGDWLAVKLREAQTREAAAPEPATVTPATDSTSRRQRQLAAMDAKVEKRKEATDATA